MGTRPTLSSTAYILIVLLLGAMAVGNYILSSPGALLVYFVGAPIVAAVVLVVLLPRFITPASESQNIAPVAPPASVKEPPPPPAKPRSESAVQLLGLLQRDGRLVDFLREDIQAYDDAQVGAAVRTIHESCRQVLAEHLPVEPVLSGQEGDAVTVPEGFDPSAIRLTGNVSGEPPFRGILQHAGWRAAQVKLPDQPVGQDPKIIAPAEVEVG